MNQPYYREAQERLRQADIDRRSTMAARIALPYGILILLSMLGRIVVFAVDPAVSTRAFQIINTLVLGAVTAAFFWAYRAARRGRPDLAAYLITFGTIGAPLSYQVEAIRDTNLTFAIIITGGAYLNAIICAGVIGSRRLLRLSTGVVIVVAAGVYLVLPRPGVTGVVIDTASQSVLFLTDLAVTVACAFIILAATLGYAKAQSSLADAERQIAQARQIDDAKNIFIRSVNHELRNPVMALGISLATLKKLNATASAEERDEMIRNSQAIVRRMRDLVASILEVNTLRDITLQLSDIPAYSAVLDATHLVASAIARDIEIAIPLNLGIRGDRVKFTQIMTNLLSNAIKYSEPPSPIAVMARRDGATVEIRVRDHGLGIPADQMPMLFQQFVRLPRDAESSVSGNGLGLYLCRIYADAMGGTITVESTGIVGQGSTFILRLPAAEGSAAQGDEATMLTAIGGQP